jgi:hypothetical protein
MLEGHGQPAQREALTPTEFFGRVRSKCTARFESLLHAGVFSKRPKAVVFATVRTTSYLLSARGFSDAADYPLDPVVAAHRQHHPLASLLRPFLVC